MKSNSRKNDPAGHGILVVNPGSTSDDVSFFRGDHPVFHKVVRYTPDEIRPFENQKAAAQYRFRLALVLEALKENKVELREINAVIGRGGALRPIPGGTYEVNDKMCEDLRTGLMGDHPANLGGLLARELASLAGARAFIADPVVVDEMEPLACYSGMPENPRISLFHALSQKRAARLAAEKLGKLYEKCSLIVMHGGGGISVGAHRGGKVIDVNNGLDGEGPFSPQRSGGVPSGGLARMCFSGKYSHDEIKLKIKGRGGLVAYTGTSDIAVLKKYIKGAPVPVNSGIDKSRVTPEKVKECLLAMAYQISKEIGALAAVLKGKVDAIVLTGGITYEQEIIVPAIKERVAWIAPVMLFPGGDEMRALREAAERALVDPAYLKKYQ